MKLAQDEKFTLSEVEGNPVRVISFDFLVANRLISAKAGYNREFEKTSVLNSSLTRSTIYGTILMGHD